MKISLLIPVYNEAPHLPEFLKLIDEIDLGFAKELVFVDDASRDRSGDILKEYAFKSETRLHRQSVNMGKGAALRKAIDLATGDIIVVQDADFEYQPKDLLVLLPPVVNGHADVVYGSRFKKNGVQVHRTYHYFVNRLLTLLSNLMSGLYVTDMETCYKVFRSDILKNIRLESARFGFEPEITAKVARLRIRVQEHPIAYFPRNYMEGKKITWKDGIAAFWHIFKFNVIAKPKDYILPSMPAKYRIEGTQWL